MSTSVQISVNELSIEVLLPLVGQQFLATAFEAEANSGETILELVEVLPLQRWRPLDGKQCFSAVFRAVGGASLDPGLCRLRHHDFEIPLLSLPRISYSMNPEDKRAYHELILN